MICEWNYKTLTVFELDLESTLKEFGKKYWEVISVNRKEDDHYLVIMKRRVYNTQHKKLDVIAP